MIHRDSSVSPTTQSYTWFPGKYRKSIKQRKLFYNFTLIFRNNIFSFVESDRAYKEKLVKTLNVWFKKREERKNHLWQLYLNLGKDEIAWMSIERKESPSYLKKVVN